MWSESYISLKIPDWKHWLLLIYDKAWWEFYIIIILMKNITHLHFVHHTIYVWSPRCFINASYFHLEVKICNIVPTLLYIFMQEQQLDQEELFHTSSHEEGTECISEVFRFVYNKSGWWMKPKKVTTLTESNHRQITEIINIFYYLSKSLLNHKIITCILLSSAGG